MNNGSKSLQSDKSPDLRRKRLGNTGEKMAAAQLAKLGYEIIATNWRAGRSGELDIVAWHKKCLVFIEVRTRRGVHGGTPEESVTPRKQARLVALVDAFLQAHPQYLSNEGQPPPCRIDVVAIQFAANGTLERLDVIENAVEG